MGIIQSIYHNRFHPAAQDGRQALWKAIVSELFPNSLGTVMDIGAGYCECINAIQAKSKYAVDSNPDVRKYANKTVVPLVTLWRLIPKKFDGKVDTIILSNVLEHLESKREVLSLLSRTYHLLAPRGKVYVIQPNIDLVGSKYWDFLDHTVPLNVPSVVEGLQGVGLHLTHIEKRFLPYTTKSFLPMHPTLVRIYLRLPQLLRPFAGQSLFVAEKRK